MRFQAICLCAGESRFPEAETGVNPNSRTTAVGLTICRSIVEALDGRLWAAPNVRMGRFWARPPIVRAPQCEPLSLARRAGGDADIDGIAG
jgi:signal transduction histidine kinase